MPKNRVLKKEKSTQEICPHTHTVHENTKLETYKPKTSMTKNLRTKQYETKQKVLLR